MGAWVLGVTSQLLRESQWTALLAFWSLPETTGTTTHKELGRAGNPPPPSRELGREEDSHQALPGSQPTCGRALTLCLTQKVTP